MVGHPDADGVKGLRQGGRGLSAPWDNDGQTARPEMLGKSAQFPTLVTGNLAEPPGIGDQQGDGLFGWAVLDGVKTLNSAGIAAEDPYPVHRIGREGDHSGGAQHGDRSGQKSPLGILTVGPGNHPVRLGCVTHL